MKRRIVDVDSPDRFVAGTTGDDPDDETVYLQAVRGARVVTVALERQQVAQLAHRMLLICGELERRGLMAIEAAPARGTGASVEGRAPTPRPPDASLDGSEVSLGGPASAPLVGPLHEEFRVGTLTIGWDNDSSRVVVEAFATGLRRRRRRERPAAGDRRRTTRTSAMTTPSDRTSCACA